MFTDWSNEGSPTDRNNQHIQSARYVEPKRTEPTMRGLEEEQAIRHILSEVLTTPSVQVHTDQVGPRSVDRETNTSVVDIRPTEEEVRADLIYAHSIGIQVPSASSELSSSTMNEKRIRGRTPLTYKVTTIGWPHFSACEKEPTCTNVKKMNLDSWRRLS